MEGTVWLAVERGAERVDGINACRRRFIENECVEILEEEERTRLATGQHHEQKERKKLTREGLLTNVSSREVTGGRTRGGMSLHVASDNVSVLSAMFAKGEEPKTEELGGDQGAEQDSTAECSSTGVPGLEGWDISGWELVALRRRDTNLGSSRRNAGADGSVSGAGSDTERRKERAVMGVSKRVTMMGT